MATLNWPGFGITSISPTLDQPSQSNANQWTGTRTVISDPWHGKWSFKVSLATVQGDAAFQAARAFFTSLKGQINTFHLPAVEAPQNANTGVTLSANAAQGATSIALTGLTTALVAGNMVTLNGQLLSLTSVGSLSGSAQTVNFMPTLRAAATSTTAVQTAKPYALVFLSDSSFSWDIGQWRRYGLTFDCQEAVAESDTADPALDNWTGGVGTGGGGGGTSFTFPQLASFTSRSLLAAVTSPSDKQVAYLTEAGREGTFVFSTANLSALVTGDTAQGIYVAPSADTSGASGAWVRKFSGAVSVKWFGAVADGVTDDSAAFVAAIAALKAYALNAGGVNLYHGSPKLFIPAGHYYLGTTTLDITHTLIIEGEGSGRAPDPAYGCTHLRWADGVCGIRAQFINTNGTAGTDVVFHDGAGAVYIKNLSVHGGYTGTTSNSSHAIVIRTTSFLDDVLIRGWGGTGVLSWTGTVNGTDYKGQLSVSRHTGVKVENCNIAFDTRGTDSNVVTFLNCEAYQCRQAGFLDFNAAGSNTYIGCHATFNGLASASVHAQVTNSGNYYAVKWGQETGAATNAPSGTTADNTWWYYVSAGTADASHPTWTNGITGLASGGDYVMLSPYATQLIDCYSEGGGFSQLSDGTLATGGTGVPLASAGGSCLMTDNSGLSLKRLHNAAILHCDGSAGAQNGIDSRDNSGNLIVGAAYWNNQGAVHIASVSSGHQFYTITAGVTTYIGSWGSLGLTTKAGGIGYETGAGGAVTQATSRTTGVTLNKSCGAITLFSAAGTASWQTFTVTNSAVAATDVVRVVQKSGTDKNMIHVTHVAAGSFDVTFATTGGTTTEAPVFNFAVIKAVAA